MGGKNSQTHAIQLGVSTRWKSEFSPWFLWWWKKSSFTPSQNTLSYGLHAIIYKTVEHAISCMLLVFVNYNKYSLWEIWTFNRYIGKTHLLHIWLCIFFLVAAHICLFISLVHILFPICNENHFSSIYWISNLVQTQRRRGKMKKKE